jgi:uncharacterized protein YjbI with pentapeptide repeats
MPESFGFLFDALRDVVGALAGAKLDDAELREAVWNGSSLISASISGLLLPAARMIPPSRGIFLPDTRKVPSA